MARPRARGGPGKSRGAARGGGYSSRSGAARPSAPRNGGGIGQGPIIAVIAIGGVLAIVLLLLLLTKGGGGEAYVAPVIDQTPRASGPASEKTAPLTDDEKSNFRQTIELLAPGEQKAKRLVREGFEAQDEQDYEVAQRCWSQARDILQGMIFEVETLAEDLGSERVELELGHYYDSVGKWQKLLSDIIKQLK